MHNGHRRAGWIADNRSALFNLLIVAVVMIVVLHLLDTRIGSDAIRSRLGCDCFADPVEEGSRASFGRQACELISSAHKPSLEYFNLVLWMAFAFALWIAWYLPTGRLLGLIIMGASVGFATEWTAQHSFLWVYINGVPLEAGIAIYALTSVTAFGAIYLISRLVSRIAFLKRTGWINCLIITAVFIGMFSIMNPGEISRVRADPLVQVYFVAMFFLAVMFGYCLRLGTLVSIIVASSLLSLVGQYAGGVRAEIWTFLTLDNGPNTLPPAFLWAGIWPLEKIVEFAFSALIGDLYIYLSKVLRQRRLEKKMPLGDRLRIPYLILCHGRKCVLECFARIKAEGVAGSMQPADGSAQPAAYVRCEPRRGSFMDSMIDYHRRTFLKTLRDSPEIGEIIVALSGVVAAALAVYEPLLNMAGGHAPGLVEGAGFFRTTLTEAAAVAGLFGLALIFAPRLFWRRMTVLAPVSFITAYTLFAGLHLAFVVVPAGARYSGQLSWAPLAFLVFVDIYGLAYLAGRLLGGIRLNKKLRDGGLDDGSSPLFPSLFEDQGEPSTDVAIASAILMFVFLALLLGHGLFSSFPHSAAAGAPAAAAPASTSLLIIVGAIILCYVFWWFFWQIPARSLLHIAAAVPVSILTLWAFRDLVGLPEGGAIWKAMWLPALAMALCYFFCFTASAHIAGEPLAKAYTPTCSRKPRVRDKKVLSIQYHDSPNNGLRREMRTGGVMHTYPPRESSVNVTIAKNEQLCQGGISAAQAVRMCLDGLVGPWTRPGGEQKEVRTVAEAVAGRTVFIKPNNVAPCGSPYTTSPEIVAEVARYCLKGGAAAVYIGEIPISNITSRMALDSTGLKLYWESIDPRIHVLLLDEQPFRRVGLQDAPGNNKSKVMFKEFHLPEALLHPDVFYIDIPKMKTHLQSAVTLGIKNSHGVIPECDRGRAHQWISQKVVDITKAWVPDLTIEDGFDALEGIGPWPGDLVELRAVVASNDVVLADLVASQLMQHEPPNADPAAPIDFNSKIVKTTWLGFEQGLGTVDPASYTRTVGGDRVKKWAYDEWQDLLGRHGKSFRWPEYTDEGLILNIGARLGRQPDMASLAHVPQEGDYACTPDREFLPLNRFSPVSKWGAARLVCDEYRAPWLGASVMFSGVFGLLKTLLENYFPSELDILDGFSVVYGPLRMPLECEGAILFGDGAIETEHMVFAPRIFQVAGHGAPPNRYSAVFERLAQEMGGKLIGFSAEAITFSRGWYW